MSMSCMIDECRLVALWGKKGRPRFASVVKSTTDD